jgi:hypothetical protein
MLMNDPRALVPIPTTSVPLILRTGARPVVPGFFIGALLAMALFLGGAPLLSMCVLALSAVSSVLVVASVELHRPEVERHRGTPPRDRRP